MGATRIGDSVRSRQAPGRHRAVRTRQSRPRAAFGAAHETVIRALDIAVALPAVVVLAPLLEFLVLLVRVTSPGPGIYRQSRLGRGKRAFTLLKLRTMFADGDDRVHREFVTSQLTGDQLAGDGRGGLFKLEDDPRVTPVGKWLRRTSLDELPQLLNVLKGDMSLVGPRPVLAWEAELFPPEHQSRFEVKPGITGLWQVSGRSRLTMQQALELDTEYVRRRSVAFDLRILLRTVPALFRGGAV
jgi:lipopolysaccharide/colanic/teichoic acid biosynthesis glycosyltransferase